jgi:LysM repeat protein
MWRLLVTTTLAAVVLGVLIVLSGSAALLSVNGGTLQVVTYEVSLAPIPATVEIHPDTLNLKSHGGWLTAYVELPEGYDVGDIDVATVRLCLDQMSACPEDTSVPAQEHASAVGDYDRDGIPDLMVKFDRQEVIDLLAGQTGDIVMPVTGMVNPPGRPFAGSDTIRVFDDECGDNADNALCKDKETPETSPAPEAAPAAEPPAITPEPAQPPPAAAPAGPTFQYQVQPGDTLFDIALRFGADVETLATLNGLSSARVVWVGQVLQVPGTAPASPPPPPAPTSTPSQPSVPTLEYTVRPGESLSDVATFFGTTVEVIAALNSLANANLVVPGQRLLVPALPATTAPGREFMSEYVVQSGETLTDIAERFGTTIEALATANSLANPSAIRVGDHLLVP